MSIMGRNCCERLPKKVNSIEKREMTESERCKRKPRPEKVLSCIAPFAAHRKKEGQAISVFCLKDVVNRLSHTGCFVVFKMDLVGKFGEGSSRQLPALQGTFCNLKLE